MNTWWSDDERTLVGELGLDHAGHRLEDGWVRLGKVDVEEGETGEVTVDVMCMPAKFWRFTILSRGRTNVLETGSGSLRDYWPTAEAFASGMLVVK